jgi:hypothetical protein
VHLEKKLYGMCMMTGEGVVAFDTIQSCVQLCMNEYKGRLQNVHTCEEREVRCF